VSSLQQAVGGKVNNPLSHATGAVEGMPFTFPEPWLCWPTSYMHNLHTGRIEIAFRYYRDCWAYNSVTTGIIGNIYRLISMKVRAECLTVCPPFGPGHDSSAGELMPHCLSSLWPGSWLLIGIINVLLFVRSVTRVQFPVMAEYFKRFFPGWSHALPCTQFRAECPT